MMTDIQSLKPCSPLVSPLVSCDVIDFSGVKFKSRHSHRPVGLVFGSKNVQFHIICLF